MTKQFRLITEANGEASIAQHTLAAASRQLYNGNQDIVNQLTKAIAHLDKAKEKTAELRSILEEKIKRADEEIERKLNAELGIKNVE